MLGMAYEYMRRLLVKVFVLILFYSSQGILCISKADIFYSEKIPYFYIFFVANTDSFDNFGHDFFPKNLKRIVLVWHYTTDLCTSNEATDVTLWCHLGAHPTLIWTRRQSDSSTLRAQIAFCSFIKITYTFFYVQTAFTNKIMYTKRAEFSKVKEKWPGNKLSCFPWTEKIKKNDLVWVKYQIYFI